MPTYQLAKPEPDELSIRDLRHLGAVRWGDVRNYQARNPIRSVNPGDLFFSYHSSCPQPDIVGTAHIKGEAYPDPTAPDLTSPYHDPKANAEKNPWSAHDVSFAEAFTEVVPLTRLKVQDTLANLTLVRKGSRLSVMPVSAEEWQATLPPTKR